MHFWDSDALKRHKYIYLYPFKSSSRWTLGGFMWNPELKQHHSDIDISQCHKEQKRREALIWNNDMWDLTNMFLGGGWSLETLVLGSITQLEVVSVQEDKSFFIWQDTSEAKGHEQGQPFFDRYKGQTWTVFTSVHSPQNGCRSRSNVITVVCVVCHHCFFFLVQIERRTSLA